MKFTSSERGTRPIVAAHISACGGDRKDALLRTISGEIPVDAISGDYMAELNLAWLSTQLAEDPTKGYEQSFLPQFELAAPKYIEWRKKGRDIKIAVNAGGLRPETLAYKIKQVLNNYGPSGEEVKVAWITGDNILHLVNNPSEGASRGSIKHLSHGTPFNDWGYEPITANAYIGCFGIVEALHRGADIIISGRTTDAGGIQAFGCWWHGWKETDLDNLALGLVTGHIIECGTYATGGFFAGFKSIKNYYDLAFPLAEIHGDGQCIVTKQPGYNGIVTVDTTRCQLLYEIQGRYYYNPDVVADLDSVRIEQVGKDRVRVHGVKGLAPPETLKVSIIAQGGWQAEINAFAIGLDIEEKAASWAKMSRLILGLGENGEDPEGKFETFSVQTLGTCAPNPQSQNAATVHVRIFAQAKDRNTMMEENFKDPIIENLISAYPGFTPSLEYHRTGSPKPFLAYFPGLLSRKYMDPIKVHFLDSDEILSVDHPQNYAAIADLPKQENYEPTNPVPLEKFGETVSIPLGYQVYARSGDKGANVNCGFFPRGDSQEAWDWLRSYLTTPKIMELLGDDATDVERVERVEFPGIHGVHFVFVGILSGGGGGGVSSTSRADSLGKGLSEYLRAKYVDYPKKLYEGYEKRI